MELKLAKLPDRTPVTIKIAVKPELNRRLSQYADCYRAAYGGDGETVAELIPYMPESFLESDRGFAKALKDREANGAAGEAERPADRRQRRVTAASTDEPSS